MLVARLVVDGEASLDGGLDGFDGQRSAGTRDLGRPLQDTERAPGVAVGGLRDPLENLRRRVDPGLAEAPLSVRDGVAQQFAKIVPRERLEHHDGGPRQERAHDLETRVLRGCADEHDVAGLDMGEKRVLLRFVEPVYLVAEQYGPPPRRASAGPRLGDDLADPRHSFGDRAERDEGGVG